MNEETELVEHDDGPTCWCNPRLFEPCAECEPFSDEMQVAQALAVHVPAQEITAKRPKKAKGCWKCQGDGLSEVVEREGEEPCIVIHNDSSKPEIITEGF